jgi:hypothetical protein
MRYRENEGLGGSLLLYITAILAVVSVVAIPTYWFASGKTLENPGMAAYDAPYGATLIRRDNPATQQLARLKQQTIIDASQLAALNARAQAPDKTKRVVKQSGEARAADNEALTTRDHNTRVAQPRNGFFFGLF